MSDVKNALEMIHKNEYPTNTETNNLERIKEFFTKGFQINRCYEEDWDFIKSTFRHYKVEINAHAPIITISQRKYVEMAKEITEKIKDNGNLRAKVATGIHSGKENYEKIVDGKIFISVLRILPTFAQKYSEQAFKSFITNTNAEQYMERLMQMNGTIKSTDEQVDNLIDEIVSSLK